MSKNLWPLLTILIVAAALIIAGTACSGNVSVGDNSANTAANKTNSETTTNTSGPTQSAPKNIAGNYSATGTNPDDAGKYEADLVVTKRDDVYQFSWNSKGTAYDGVGVHTDNAVAVAYTTGKNGQGCGVVLYKINADGSLDGKVGYWGENKMETEKAVRKTGSDLEGEYDISGKNPEGQEYKGTLKIKKEGLGYDFTWTAPDSLQGFGIKAGELIAVGFGGKQCSFVGYDVKADGTLDGSWGGRGVKKLGTEVAKKK